MRFCIDRNTAEIQSLGTIAGQPANSISVAEDEKGTMQFFALGMANYMGGGDALLVFQQHNGELIPMHGSGDIRSLAEHKPMAARSPQGKGIYHLFTVGQGQVPYMHTADMSADGHSGGLKGSFTQTNRPLDNSGALYGQHISVAEDGSRGLRAYMSRHIPAAEMSQPGITELVVFNISPAGDVTGPQVLASIESNDRLGRGEITLSPDGRTLAYFNRNRYLGGFDYHTVEIYTIALDQSGLIASSQPKLKAKGADYGTGRKGSIEWLGSDLYWNQYGLYSDGKEPVFARVLKTGQTQPVSSGEYGDLRTSDRQVYKLGQAGTSLKTASATSANDDRPGYLPGQPWRASGTGPQLSYRRKGIRQYELTDHLGNVRAVIGDRLKTETAGTATAYKPELLSATDYFPFGMQMPERVYRASEGYRYGFNGKEKEDAVNEDGYDFGARLLNTWNGKWMAVDPLAAKYPGLSAYAFVANSPIVFVDPDGKEIVFSDAFKGSEKMIQVFDQLKQTSTFSSMLSKFDGPKPILHLYLDMRNMGSNPNAYASPQKLSPYPFSIAITVNTNYSDVASDISIARTILHESIHAKIFRSLEGNNGRVSQSDFPGLYDYIVRHSASQSGWQHELMAAHYRGEIANGLKEYDKLNGVEDRAGTIQVAGTSVEYTSAQFYDAMSWGGLHDTKAWGSLGSDQQDLFRTIITQEQGSDISTFDELPEIIITPKTN